MRKEKGKKASPHCCRGWSVSEDSIKTCPLCGNKMCCFCGKHLYSLVSDCYDPVMENMVDAFERHEVRLTPENMEVCVECLKKIKKSLEQTNIFMIKKFDKLAKKITGKQ